MKWWPPNAETYLRLVGWRVYRQGIDGTRFYATGACTWTGDKRRAFVFADAPGSARKGNDDGLKWARAHAKHLLAERKKSEHKWKPLRLRIVCIRIRTMCRPSYSLVSTSDQSGKP